MAAPLSAASATTSIVVADDSYLVREAVTRLLETNDDLSVVGVAGSYDELVALVDEVCPNIVVTDIRMPPTGTDEGVRAGGRAAQDATRHRGHRAQPVRRACLRHGPVRERQRGTAATCSRNGSPTSTGW